MPFVTQPNTFTLAPRPLEALSSLVFRLRSLLPTLPSTLSLLPSPPSFQQSFPNRRRELRLIHKCSISILLDLGMLMEAWSSFQVKEFHFFTEVATEKKRALTKTKLWSLPSKGHSSCGCWKAFRATQAFKSKVGYHFPGKVMCGSNYNKEASVETISTKSEWNGRGSFC